MLIFKVVRDLHNPPPLVAAPCLTHPERNEPSPDRRNMLHRTLTDPNETQPTLTDPDEPEPPLLISTGRTMNRLIDP